MTSDRPDLGVQALDTIFADLQIDETWAVRIGRGFTWWPHRHAQTIWAEEGVDSDPTVFRINVATDWASSDDVPERGFQAIVLPSLLLQAGLNALIVDEDRVRMRASAIVHEDNRSWVLRMVELAALAQATSVEASQELLERIQLEPVESQHPTSGWRAEPDEMLSALADLPGKTDPPAWTEPDELETIARMFNDAGGLAFADDGQLSAEIPFGPNGGPVAAGGESHLMLIQPGDHPMLGGGVRLRLSLRRWPEIEGVQALPIDLNAWECAQPPMAHLVGSWTIEPERDAVPFFTCFLPNVLHRPGVLTNLALSMALRARLVSTLIS